MKHRDEVTMLVNYGPLKEGKTYPLVGQGRDFFKIKIKGHIYNVPMSFCKGVDQWAAGAEIKENRKRRKKRKQSK